MSEMTRRFLTVLQGQVPAQNRPGTAGREAAGDLPVEIGLPTALTATAAAEIRESVSSGLAVLSAGLGLTGRPAVTVRETAAGTSMTASVYGRPVLCLPPDRVPPRDRPEAVARMVVSRAARRLPLLAGPAVARSSTAAYLLAVGCRPQDAPVDSFDVERAERLLNERHDEIVLEVAARTLRWAGDVDAGAAARLREDEFQGWGIGYPDFRVVPTDEPAGTVRLRFNDVTLPAHRLAEDAAWSDVVRHLGRKLAPRRHWFVRLSDVAQVLDDDLAYSYPDLVTVAVANYTRAQITACVREMLRSGRRARNLLRVLWLLIEAGGSPAGPDILRMSESPLLPKARRRPPADRDPMVQAVRVRKLAAEEDWRTGRSRLPRYSVRLAPDTEERLVALADTPDRMQDLAEAEWAAVRAFAAAPGVERVYTRTVAALRPIRDALAAVDSGARVRASHELPPGVDLNAFTVLADPGT
jgi:hypothetical protein